MPKEQKLTLQSPLALLTKPGVLRQNALPGLPAPTDTSRFSVARVEFTLKRDKGTVRRVKGRDGTPGHTLRTEHPQNGFASSLTWSEGDNGKVIIMTELTGNVTMTPEGNALVFQNETGGILKYNHAGANINAPTPLRRQRALEAEKDVPWYNKSSEAVGTAGVRLEAMPVIVRSIPERKDTTRGTQRVSFTISPVSDQEVVLPVDVYNDRPGVRGGNPRRISQILDKKVQTGETILLTGHYHADMMMLETSDTNKTTKQFERKWVRLMALERPAPSAPAPATT